MTDEAGQYFPNNETTTANSSRGLIYQGVDRNLLHEQLNPDLILVEVKNYLLGITHDVEGNPVRSKSMAYMNDNGANYVISMLTGIVNNNTVLSNIDEKEAYDICRYMMFEIAMHLGFNNEDYELELKKLGSVINFVKNMVLLTLKRSVDKTTLKALTQVERVQYSQVSSPQSERKPIFGMMSKR